MGGPVPPPAMNWIDFPDDRFTVNGLAWWNETRPKLQRFPDRMKERLPESVWGLSLSPSGGRIRFATDASSLALRLHYPRLNHMNNMPRVGQLGVDVWVNGQYWRPVFPAGDDGDLEAAAFEDLPVERREICMYLGLYAPVEVLAIGLSEGATIEPPSPFALEPPVVYYGSSITQGGCASRAGNAYQAIVSRRLNLDFINLGFSGSGRGEPEVADAVAEVGACCFVMDWAQNCRTMEEFTERYDLFIETIRRAHPDTPIVCVTPIFSTSEVWGGNAKNEAMREHVRGVVSARRDAGDEGIVLVEGFDMLGPDDRDGLVDASHPNDVGFISMAAGIEPALRQVLGL